MLTKYTACLHRIFKVELENLKSKLKWVLKCLKMVCKASCEASLH